MRLIKEWYGKKGILARWYACGDIYFLDYNMCHDTTRLFIEYSEGKVVVKSQIPDAPKKYLNEIASLYMKGVR